MDSGYQSPPDRQEQAARIKVAGMVISQLLLGAPDRHLHAQLVDPVMLDAWPLSDSNSRRGVAILRTSDEDDDPARDYLYLLRGIGRPLVEPHESARFSREHLVFDEQTQEVRRAYALAGFTIDKLNREPDDHIGYQVAFLTELAGNISTDVATAQEKVWADVAGQFMDAHTDRFFDDVCAGLDEHATGATYRALPHLMRGWHDELHRLLAEVRA